MKSLTELQKLIITIIISIIFIGLLAYLIFDINEEIKTVEASIVNQERTLKDTQAKVDQIAGLKADIKELESRIGDMERTLPNDKEVPLLLRQMQQLITKTGIQIDSLTPSGPVAKKSKRGAKKGKSVEFYNRYALALSLTGEYHQLMRFISGIEHMKRFTSIEKISVSGKSKKLKIKLTIVTYAFKKK